MRTLKILTTTILLLLSALQAQSQTLIIDNWAPYVKKLEIFSATGTPPDLIYSEEWNWDATAGSEKLNFLPSNCINEAAKDQDVSIIIHMSEAMANVDITIDGIPAATQLAIKDGSDLQWKATISAATISGLYTADNINRYRINIMGEDLNRNPIDGFDKAIDERSISDIKIRTSSTQFTPNTTIVPDNKHVLRIGDPFIAGNGCMHSDFSADKLTREDDEEVRFTSRSFGNITQYKWTFEEGNPPEHIGEIPPPVKYPIAGTFDVSLTVSDGAVNFTETKLNYITVTKSMAYNSNLDFTYNYFNFSIGTTPQYQFTGIISSSGIMQVSKWHWTFSSGSSTPPDKKAVTNSFAVPEIVHTITLTVTFTDGSTKSKTQKLYPSGYPFGG